MGQLDGQGHDINEATNGRPAPVRQYSTLREWAYTQLREMIVTGVLAPGADIHEGQLCAQLNMSKSPLREALRQLAQEGFVVAISNKGSRVSTLTADDISEIFSLRDGIEVMAVRLAAERATPDQVAELRANVAALKRSTQGGSIRDFAERDVEFHLLVARIAGHRRLLRIQESLQAEMLRLVIQQVIDWGDEAKRDAVAMHGAIVDAVEGRDAAMAVARMQAHIRRGEELQRDALARRALAT